MLAVISVRFSKPTRFPQQEPDCMFSGSSVLPLVVVEAAGSTSFRLKSLIGEQ